MDRRRLYLALIGLSTVLPSVFVAGQHARGQTLDRLRERMAAIQDELDATTARVEELRTQEGELMLRIRELDSRIKQIEEENADLLKRVIERARSLYMDGGTGMLESLLGASDIAELSAALEYATRTSDSDTLLFLRHKRIADELRVVRAEAEVRARELTGIRESLDAEAQRLQERFAAAQDEYDALKKRLAAQAARRESASAAAPSTGSTAASLPRPTGDMTCPIAAPTSFIDSWGYPRSGGRTHEGTDMMAAEGAPVVAITSGTITYSGWGDTAGNWLVLSGNDGNSYWYLHNRENLTSGGPVKVGEQIATVGNSGNAAGGPTHVHFEYHPGGGGPVNPYPLVAGLC